MCLSCGCGEPNERHGDDRHITADDLTRAARASNISPQEAAQNILAGTRQMGGEEGWQAEGTPPAGAEPLPGAGPGEAPAGMPPETPTTGAQPN